MESDAISLENQRGAIMADTVFILGAGASRDAGGPLIGDFISRIEKMQRFGNVADCAADIDLFLRARGELVPATAKCSFDLNNLEIVLSAFELAGILGRLGTLDKSDVAELIPSSQRVIRATLDQSMLYEVGANGALQAHPSMQSLVKLFVAIQEICRQSVAVITFNYDLGLDYALHKANVDFTYGFDDISEPQFGSPEGQIPLLKLHGSLNWRQDDDRLEALPWGEHIFNQAHAEKLVTISSDELLAPGSPSFHPFIVPPIGAKTGYYKLLSNVWRNAGEVLNTAQNFVIIGYSLPDTDVFFKHLFALGTLSKMTLNKVIAVGPEVPKRVAKLLPQHIATRNDSFIQINQQMPESLRLIGNEFGMADCAKLKHITNTAVRRPERVNYTF